MKVVGGMMIKKRPKLKRFYLVLINGTDSRDNEVIHFKAKNLKEAEEKAKNIQYDTVRFCLGGVYKT